MTTIKFNRIAKLSVTARYPRTFRARLADIDVDLLGKLTSKQIATLVDGPMQRSYSAGQAIVHKDAQR